MVHALLLSEKKKMMMTKHGKSRGRFLPEHTLSLESKVSLAAYATDTFSWEALLPVSSPKQQ